MIGIYTYVTGSDNGSPMFKRPGWIHPAIQLSLTPGCWALGIASNFFAEKWTFLWNAGAKTGFEWSGYRIGVHLCEVINHILLECTDAIAVGYVLTRRK